MGRDLDRSLVEGSSLLDFPLFLGGSTAGELLLLPSSGEGVEVAGAMAGVIFAAGLAVDSAGGVGAMAVSLFSVRGGSMIPSILFT